MSAHRFSTFVLASAALALLAAPALATSGRAEQQAAAAPAQPQCVTQTEDFTDHKTFVIEITNACAQRQRCEMHAYVVNARGPTKGEATLILEPGRPGQETRETLAIELLENYGEANTSYSCDEI